MEEKKEKKYLTVKEFTEAINKLWGTEMKENSVYTSLMKQPNFPYKVVKWEKGGKNKQGGKYRICLEDVLKWVASGGRPVE